MNMQRILLIAPLLSAAVPAFAQTSPAPDGQSDRVRIERDLIPPGPADRSENFIRGINFDLKISEDESKASIAYGGYSTRNYYSGESARQVNQSWSIKLALPVGGADDITSRSTLEALGDGPKLTLSYGLFGFGAANITSDKFTTIMAAARDGCVHLATTPAGIESCQMAPPDVRFARQYSGFSLRDINKSVFSGLWRVGFDGSVAMKRFKFIDASTLADRKQTKFQFTGGFYAAWYPADGVSGIIGRAEYQNGFESADDAILCKPVVVTPNDDCKSGAPMPPHRVERVNLSVEGRRVFAQSRLGRWAISPRGTIDALSGDYEVELPLYFIPKGDWKVLPGASIGYVSRKDKVTFGVFLRTAFSFD